MYNAKNVVNKIIGNKRIITSDKISKNDNTFFMMQKFAKDIGVEQSGGSRNKYTWVGTGITQKQIDKLRTDNPNYNFSIAFLLQFSTF